MIITPVGNIQAEAEENTIDPVEMDYDINDISDDDNDAKMTKDGNQVMLTSGNFHIEVNSKGQVPFYHFNTTIDDIRFFLKFQRMTQFKDENINDRYDKGEEIGRINSDLQLPSVKWELDIVTDEDTEKEFIFRSTEIYQGGFEDMTIELINHFTADSSYVKFDINITNWPFEEETTGLCLEFELNWSRGSNEDSGMNLKKESDETSIYLRNDDDVLLAYFESASDVNVDGELITDGAQLYDTASANASKVNILINYPRFTDTLFHDPKIGTSYNAILPINLWLTENVKNGFLAVTAIITLLLGTFVVLSRRFS